MPKCGIVPPSCQPWQGARQLSTHRLSAATVWLQVGKDVGVQ